MTLATGRAIPWRELLFGRASPRRAYVTGALVGALVMLGIFGLRWTLGVSESWAYPRGDPKYWLMGYQHFLHEPWGWPPAVVQSVSPPHGQSLMFTDSIPLLALVAKVLFPVVPGALRASFERPYGLWLLLVFVLQGVMAARADRRFGAGSIASAALTAALLCTMPTFLVRFGHEGLDSHFFLFWGLFLVLSVRRERPRRRDVVEWTALLLLVTLTHPYLMAMCLGLFAAWCVTGVLTHRREARAVAAAVLAGPMAVVFALGLLGLLEVRSLSGHANGFGVASFNPLSVFVSQFSAIQGALRQLPPLARLLDPQAADATGFQFEGQSYLGAGLFVILAVASSTRPRALGATMRRHHVLLVLFAVFLVFALSNRVFFARQLLFAYPWPRLLEPVATQLRSSGRFIWLPAYAFVLWGIAQVARRGRSGTLMLAGALLVQLADVRPFITWIHGYTSGPEPRYLDWAAWHPVLAAHREVWSYPSFDCPWFLRDDDERSRAELLEVSFLAAEDQRIVSSLWSPRLHEVCSEEVAAREAIVARDGVLYVLFRRVATGHALAALERQGARCLSFGTGFACSTRFGDAEARLLEPSKVLPHDPATGWVDFREGTDSLVHQGPGWGPADATGRWVGREGEGNRTTFHYRPSSLATSYAFEIEVESGAPEGPPAELEVAINGRAVGTLVAPRGAGAQRSRFCVPREAPGVTRWIGVDLLSRGGAPLSAARVHVRAARLSPEGC